MLSDERLLLEGELQRIRIGQHAGQLRSESLRRLTARRENQNRSKILRQSFGDQAWPVALDFVRHMHVEIVRIDFLQRNRTLLVPDEHGFATQSIQPFHDILRVRHATAQEEQLGRRRSQRDGQFVVQPTIGIAEHLIFIHHQKRRAIPFNQASFLRLQRGDEDGRIEILRQISGGDSNIPTARPPFGQFVIGQSPGGHGINRLPMVSPLIRPQLEDERLARSRWGMDHHILLLAQGKRPRPAARDQEWRPG